MEFWTASIGLAKMRTMPAALADNLDTWVDDVAKAERLGYDGFGAPEHHFMYDGFVPFPLQALSAAAAATSKIRLVAGAMLLTLYDPLAAAEHAATLDVLSNGRVTLGLGMGYRPMEFDGLGTAKRTRGARLTEAMEIIRLATAEDRFTYEGQHYNFSDTALLPRPVQQPIDMWFCGGTSLQGARRAGQSGFGYWLANSPLSFTEKIVKEYRHVGREAGWPEEQLRIASFKDICIGETLAEAEEMRQMMLDVFYDEHILGYGYLIDDDGEHLYNPPKDHPAYRRFIDALYCGTVEMVIEELKRYEQLGFEALMVLSPQWELIAEKVIPEFRT